MAKDGRLVLLVAIFLIGAAIIIVGLTHESIRTPLLAVGGIIAGGAVVSSVGSMVANPKFKEFGNKLINSRKRKFNMFTILNKYKIKKGAGGDSKPSYTRAELVNKIREVMGVIAQIDRDDSQSKHDKGLLKNLAVMDTFKFSWDDTPAKLLVVLKDKARHLRYIGHNKDDILSERARQMERDVNFDKDIEEELGFRPDRTYGYDEATFEEIRKQPYEYFMNLPVSAEDMLVAIVENDKLMSFGVPEERSLEQQDATYSNGLNAEIAFTIYRICDIDYDIYKCTNLNILSAIFNDTTNRSILVNFINSKEVRYLRDIYWLSTILTSANVLSKHYKEWMTEEDRKLMYRLKKMQTISIADLDPIDFTKLSGIMKLHLTHMESSSLKNFGKEENQQTFKRLYEHCSQYNEFVDTLSRILGSSIIYPVNFNSLNYLVDTTVLVIDGADEINKQLNVQCPSKDIDTEHLLHNPKYLTEWCKNGKIIGQKAKLVHEDKNLGCKEDARNKFIAIQDMCSSNNNVNEGPRRFPKDVLVSYDAKTGEPQYYHYVYGYINESDLDKFEYDDEPREVSELVKELNDVLYLNKQPSDANALKIYLQSALTKISPNTQKSFKTYVQTNSDIINSVHPTLYSLLRFI